MESESGKGTMFTLFLPLIAAAEPKHEEEPVQPVEGSGTVMIVDDEEDLRFVAGEMIKSMGYSVVLCKDGVEAVEYYAAHHAAVDAVVVDMIMPRMGGYECISKLKQINPAARVLVSSGYGLPGNTQMIITKGIAGFIQKPFRIEELSQALAGVMKRKS
jgi:two-component system, cell cycle sensor histidine kinase and response regulator CckA